METDELRSSDSNANTQVALSTLTDKGNVSLLIALDAVSSAASRLWEMVI